MFCFNCGQPLTDWGQICKGCDQVGLNVREELLSFTEKSNDGDSDLKCKECGADIVAGSHYCVKCGSPTSH